MRLTYTDAVNQVTADTTEVKTINLSPDITVRIGFGSATKPLAKIALYNRLYVSGWMLSGYLKDICEDSYYHGGLNKCGIALVYLKGIPVSISLLHPSGELNSFTRKSMRKKGFGKIAVSRLVAESIVKTGANYAYGHSSGIDGCFHFFSKSLYAANNIR